MERKISRLTPANYTRAIISLSRRYSSTSAFPGNSYTDIAEWMLQDRSLLRSSRAEEYANPFASNSKQPHHLVIVYNSGDRKWDVQQYSQEQPETFSTASSASEGGPGQLVFIRGFVSPSWVSVIGSKYSIDPEFFRRHMDYLSVSVDRHAYGFPSLVSSSNNIIRLCVSTLLHRDGISGQDLQPQRSNQVSELAAYRTQLLKSNRVSCGDSLVREYSTLCSTFSVIEQWISLCITKTDRGWAVIVWMDQGRPLEQSPPGPWTTDIQSKATPLPVLQYHHKMAFRTTTNRLDPDANASAEVQQSTAILPLQYDSLLALVGLSRRAPQDPLSSCTPLFAHAAFSEVQFLNLIESKIQIQINAIAQGLPPDALGTLQYFCNILDRHGQQLKDCTRALCKLAERQIQGLSEVKAESPEPKGLAPHGMSSHENSPEGEFFKSGQASNSDGPFSTTGLLEDYEELRVRCIDLSKMCSWGITLAMSKASIEESRKAIEQSERVKKLTLLATFFIPLSFTCSLFGMNVDVLGQSKVEFWWFFVLCVPITLFAYTIYLWDIRALRHCWKTSWKTFREISRATKIGTREKDPSSIV